MITRKFEDLCIKRAQGAHLMEMQNLFLAFEHKTARIEFHVKSAQDIYKSIFHNKSVVRLASLANIESLNNVAYEIESMIEVLNTLPDMIAQLLRLLFLFDKVSKEDVSIFKALDILDDKTYQKLKKQINCIIKSTSFQYIRGFCNVSKHHSLVDRDHHRVIDYRNKGSKSGIRFQAFQYRGKNYPEMMAQDIEQIRIAFIGEIEKTLMRIEDKVLGECDEILL